MMVAWPTPVDPDPPRHGSRHGSALLMIGLGGAIGTLARHTLESAFPAAQGTWPWTTFCINVTGAFVLAVLLETLTVFGPDEGWFRRIRLGVGTGILGGFTTYSTFMVETVQLGGSGGYVVALGYAVGSLVLGFAAAYAGMVGVGAVHRRRVGRA